MKVKSKPLELNTPASKIIVDHPCYINAREALQSCLDSFGTADVWCLPILGPSGSGKTTIIREFAARHKMVNDTTSNVLTRFLNFGLPP